MSRLLCCLRARRHDMGAALSHPQEGEACDGGVTVAPPTMADVIRERKKKAGGAALGTLRRRIVNAARRPRDHRPDRGCEHARFIRSVVSSWRLAEVFLLCEELEAGAALRDLSTQADLAREPAPALHAQLPSTRAERWWCDVELCGGGGAGSWSVCAHRCILAARSGYFRDLLQRYPPSCVRVPLEGLCANMTRAECEACVTALYSGTTPRTRSHTHSHSHHSNKYDNESAEAELDIINVDNNSRNNTCTCSNSVSPRIVAALAVSRDPLHTSMHYLLDSGEMADTRLVFRLENGCGSAYGFRTALELPCHRVVLAARSRFFKSMMSRRGSSSAGSGAVCVDEKVLPRRYARALLHAAYTDQVDLSLIGRNSSSPPSTNSGSTSAWAGVGRSNGSASRPTTTAMLDDAFQLYEIARFLEMPIVVQGCEDAIVEALAPETLPHVLRWAAAPHASHWVHRQAMRYLRDEFTVIMSHSAAARIPRGALTQALASDHLQASEQQILRALIKWSADQPPQREPNVVWHTSHSVSRRGARRRSGSDAALRETLSSLVPLVRTEHLPHDSDMLHQLVRRGIIPSPPPPSAEEGSTAHAWLGRGSYRPARCFLPYLDEIKALLEGQTVPEAELARARRARYLHRIPDTLYMVAAARNPESVCSSPSAGAGEPTGAGGAEGGGAGSWLLARTAHGLRARARELRALPAAHTALTHHAIATHTHRQVTHHANAGAGAAAGGGGGAEGGGAGSWLLARTAHGLRARARELRALPAAHTALTHHAIATHTHRQIALRAVREMGLPDACADILLHDEDNDNDSEQNTSDWEASAPSVRDSDRECNRDEPCCRTLNSNGSIRCASAGSLRSAPTLHIPLDISRTGTCERRPARTESHNRRSSGEWGLREGPAGPRGSSAERGRLSAAVPDVAMAPNANTHLLTHRDYFRHPPPWEYGGVVLQLDLGDGATHTPRPGSRAQRNSNPTRTTRTTRDHAQAMSCLRARSDEDELRAAIELSVIRAYSSFHGRAGSSPPPAPAPQPQPQRRSVATLPQYRSDLPQPGASNVVSGRHVELPQPTAPAAPTLQALGRVSDSASPRASPSPRRRHEYSLYRPQYDYRLEPQYGSSASTSRGHSPNNYA